MERGQIELRLANGKSVVGTGEELFYFERSEGKSIIPPPKVIDKVVNGVQVGNIKK